MLLETAAGVAVVRQINLQIKVATYHLICKLICRLILVCKLIRVRRWCGKLIYKLKEQLTI